MRTQFPISLVPYEQYNEQQRTRKVSKQRRSHLQIVLENKRLRFGFRLTCTIVLFAILLRSVSWPMLLMKLRDADPGMLLVGVIVGLSGIIVSAYQWQSLLQAEDIHIDLRRLINLYLVGIAFNHFLPTGMGGDVVKAYYVGKEGNNHSGSASAVIMSRVTGFWGMLLVSVPVMIIQHAIFKQTLIIAFTVSCLIMCGTLGAIFVLVMLLSKVKSRWLNGRAFGSTFKIGITLRNSLARPRAMRAATLFGMLFHITAVLNYYSLAIALHIDTVPVMFYLVAIPLISLVSFLPITFNGFGIRETSVVYIFSVLNYWYVAPEASLMLALLMDVQLLLFGLIGGCIYLAMGDWKIKAVETSIAAEHALSDQA
jgi:glycosyltransferase 2 family protein